MRKKKAKIYAFKNKGISIYIGKTIIPNNNNGILTKSLLNISYANPKLRKQILNNDNITIDILEEVSTKNWFDPKLKKIIEKHNEGAKLVNAQHFLDGKRSFWEGTDGYWKGKKRDKNTINRMMESKYKTVLQYSSNGILIKEWDSIKSAAINIFNDYELINGSAKSSLYHILSSKKLETRFRFNSYWFKREEFKTAKIPINININKILESQKIVRSKRVFTKAMKKKYIYNSSKPIYEIDPITKKIIGSYVSTKEASKKLNLCESAINRCCRYERDFASKRSFIFLKIKDREKYYDRLEKRNKIKSDIKTIKQNAINTKLERIKLRKKMGKILYKKDKKYLSKLKRPIQLMKNNKSIDFNTVTLAAHYLETKAFYVLNALINNNKIQGYSFKYLDIM